MKILELRFKNLNSLYGEWCIDFTAPEYVSDGIFAMTGPTGSGKSTILDAICLALYGTTPRLGKITKSGNQIMSRQTGECSAEVLFVSQFGRFRCRWEQRRARKKPTGALQFPEHQIVDDATGTPIETKRSLVTGVIEQKTGMDFDRFTRSILLAQGGFDTFLKADAEQKSRILEQITGTEIYSDISRRVHERQRDEQAKRERLRTETAAIEILDTENEERLRQTLAVKRKEEKALAVQIAEREGALAWLTGIENLEKDIKILSGEALTLQGEADAFKTGRSRLKWGLRAAALEGDYAALEAIRTQQSDDRATAETEQVLIPELTRTVALQKTTLQTAESATAAARKTLGEAAPLIVKIRSLDQKIEAQNRALSEKEQSIGVTTAKIKINTDARETIRNKRKEAERKHDAATTYLKKHAEDQWLLNGIAGIEEQLENIRATQKALAGNTDDCRKAEKKFEQAAGEVRKHTAAYEKCKRDHSEAVERIAVEQENLHALLNGRLLREYLAEKDNLLRERAYLMKISELSDHRSRLENGQACPLCGATEHPYAAGSVPTPDKTDRRIHSISVLIGKAERQEEVIRSCEKAADITRTSMDRREKILFEAEHHRKNGETVLASVRRRNDEINEQYASQREKIECSLAPTKIELEEENLESTLSLLKSRASAWEGEMQAKDDIEKELTHFDSERQRLDAVVETHTGILIEHQRGQAHLTNELHTWHTERSALFGDKNPETEENRLSRAARDAETAEKEAATHLNELQQQLSSATTGIQTLKRRIAGRSSELEKTEEAFADKLQQHGFPDEDHFRQARLEEKERERLAAQAKGLDERYTGLTARLKDRKTALAREREKKMTQETRETLEQFLKEGGYSHRQIIDSIAADKHKLEENAVAKGRIQEKLTAVEAQEKEYHRWQQLHELIGSADGKKYRNFAQGLTFELVVSHANRQLQTMTDRYLLIRDEKAVLELNVLDNYQAGEIRSTRNLSGGESFMVSLSLALGLSTMASRKVRVDSLFLDEGFGTLDEDALETALETLSNLHREDKLIGVISHVSALKDRVSTQVAVTPLSGGRSFLAGPGCRMITGT